MIRIPKRVAAATLSAGLMVSGLAIAAPAFADDAVTTSYSATVIATSTPSPEPTVTSSPTSSPTPTATLTPTPTPSATSTPSPEPTTAPSPTSSPTPAPTSSATPTPAPSEPTPTGRACANGDDLYAGKVGYPTVTVSLKDGIGSCDVGYAGYNTEGPSWPTSGQQTQYAYDFAHLSKEHPSATLSIPLFKCYGQIDLFIGTQRFDGKDGSLPHYPDSATPTNVIGSYNGGHACDTTTPVTTVTPTNLVGKDSCGTTDDGVAIPGTVTSATSSDDGQGNVIRVTTYKADIGTYTDTSVLTDGVLVGDQIVLAPATGTVFTQPGDDSNYTLVDGDAVWTFSYTNEPCGDTPSAQVPDLVKYTDCVIGRTVVYYDVPGTPSEPVVSDAAADGSYNIQFRNTLDGVGTYYQIIYNTNDSSRQVVTFVPDDGVVVPDGLNYSYINDAGYPVWDTGVVTYTACGDTSTPTPSPTPGGMVPTTPTTPTTPTLIPPTTVTATSVQLTDNTTVVKSDKHVANPSNSNVGGAATGLSGAEPGTATGASSSTALFAELLAGISLIAVALYLLVWRPRRKAGGEGR